MTLCNVFKVNNTLDIEENEEHCFHLWFWHVNFLGLWVCWLFPFQTLSFAYRIILKAPCFISN